MSKRKSVRIYQDVKAHLVNGLNGRNVLQLVVKEHVSAKGVVLDQGIVMV